MRALRFGYQLSTAGSADALRDQARRAERAGFDIVHTSDHIGEGWAPLSALVAIARSNHSGPSTRAP